MTKEIIRYNPFYSLLEDDKHDNFFEEEAPEYIENLQEMSNVLENCKSFSTREFLDMKKEMTNKYCNAEKSIF